MSNIGNLLKSGAQVLKLQDELEALEAIDTVARRWSELRPQLTSFDKVVDFLEVVDTQIGEPDVKAVFETLGLDDELAKITKHRKRISKAFEKAGVDKPTLLVRPLSNSPESSHDENTGAVNWSLIDAGEPETSVEADDGNDYDFDLGGNLLLALEGGAMWPYTLKTSRVGMVRVGVAGKLAAKGEAKLPFSLGSAGVSLSGDGSTSLDYFFEPTDQSQLLAGAVANRLRHVPNPFSIKAVRSAMNSRSDFFGYDLAMSGGMSAALEVEVGKSFELPSIGSAAIDISIMATLVRRREFQISLRRDGDPNAEDPLMKLVVSGHKNKRDEKQLGIKIALEFGKLADYLHEQLKPLVAEWDSALETIKPYLKPGTYLQNKADGLLSGVVDDLIGNSQIASAIQADMRLLLGTSEAEKLATKTFLSGEIEGALNGLVSSAIGEVNEQAEELLAGLKRRLPLFETLDQDDAILAELKKLTGEVSADFEEEVKKVTRQKAKRENIAKTLKRAGADVNRVVASADNAVKGIRKLLAEYDATIKKAMKGLTKAANRKVSLSLTYTTLKTDDTTIELDATLSPLVSQEHFNTLLSGNSADISKLLIDPPATITFGEKSSINRAVKHQQSFGGEFVGFGLAADFSEVFTGIAEVDVDHRGTVSILSKGQAKDMSKTLLGDKEVTEASFVDVISLSRAKEAEADKSKPDVLEMGLNLRRTDKKGLSRKEFNALMRDLFAYKLITKEGADEARQAVEAWTLAGNGRSIPVVIDVTLPLTGDQILQVLRADPSKRSLTQCKHGSAQPLRAIKRKPRSTNKE